MASVYRSAYRNATMLFVLMPALVAMTGMSAPAFAQNTKIAFIADQGADEGARRVLELVRDEGADLLMIQGDLGYGRDAAAAWINNIDGILGENFPVLLVVGNHEDHEWPTYLQWQKDKLARVSDIECEGDISVKAYCTYRDFGIVQVAPGIGTVEGVNGGDNYADYITEKLSADKKTWRICSWHMVMHDMQAGAKPDESGWGVYQSCLEQGGLVLTGHEHSYSRTHLMSSFESRTIIHTGNEMDIGPNSSIAVVSGLGGFSVRPQYHDGEWFSSIYTSDQNATHGALFCDFTGSRGDCYMKDIAGRIPDIFTLKSLRASTALAEQEAAEAAEQQAQLDAQAAEQQAQLDAQAAEQQAQLDAQAAEQQAQLDAQAAEQQAQLDAEAAEQQAQLDAQAAEQQAQLDAEAAEQQAQLDAEAAEQQAQLDAQAAEQQAQLDAEAAEQQAQLDAEAILEDDPNTSTLSEELSSASDVSNPATDESSASSAPEPTVTNPVLTNNGGGGISWYYLLTCIGVCWTRRKLNSASASGSIAGFSAFHERPVHTRFRKIA